jgi:hypothetical protein
MLVWFYNERILQMNNDLLFFLLVQLYMFLVRTNYSFEIVLFYMKTKCLMKRFLSLLNCTLGTIFV